LHHIAGVAVYSGGFREGWNMAIHKHSASFYAKLTKDGMYGDGGNLWLQVTNGGTGKSWVFRWTGLRLKDGQLVPGPKVDRNLGLGPLHTVSLEMARELALKNRLLLLQGKDPWIERDGTKLQGEIEAGLAQTVNQVADEYLEAMYAGKRPASRTDAEWTIDKFIRKPIGNMPIRLVDTKTILDTVGLRDMWTAKHRTAYKVKGHLERIFSLAIHSRYYLGENPARWEDHLDHILPPREDVSRVEHYKSLGHGDVGRFVHDLRAYEDRSSHKQGRLNTAFLLEFLVLTGARTGEGRKAQWKEIDLERMIWNVPWEHRKTGRKTREILQRPITKPMLAVLEEMQKRRTDQSPDAIVFPSQNGKAYSRGTLWAFLTRRMKWEIEITNHGFRSTLKDWWRVNGYPMDLWDIQTDHIAGSTVKRDLLGKAPDNTDQAYGHDKFLDQRRRYMNLWGEYCSAPAPEPQPQTGTDNLVNLADKRRA
jgi:integrase